MQYFFSLFFGTLVFENNFNACVKKRLLSHSREENFVVEYGFLKNRSIRLKPHVKTVPVTAIALTLKRSCNSALFKSFGISFTVTAVFYLYPLGKSVNNRCTYAVQTAGDFIALTAEFSTCVQDSIYYLKRRKSKLFVHTRGGIDLRRAGIAPR